MPSWTLSAFMDKAGASTDDQLAAARRARISHIVIGSIEKCNICALPLETALTVRKKIDAAQFRVQMLGSSIGRMDIADEIETDLKKLRHLARLAPILNCNSVRISSYHNITGASPKEWEMRSLANLALLRDEAEKLNLVLYHENKRHTFGNLGVNVKKIAALRNASFKLLFNFVDFHQAGEDVFTVWQSLCEQTDAFHLKDITQSNHHVPVGQGNCQVERILRDAFTKKWSGPVSVDPRITHSPTRSITSFIGFFDNASATMPLEESVHLAVEETERLLNAIGVKWI